MVDVANRAAGSHPLAMQVLPNGEHQFQTSADSTRRAARQQRRLERFDADAHVLPAGARLILSVVVNDAVLTRHDLSKATGKEASIYGHGDSVVLEWPRVGEWRDRRELSPATRGVLLDLGGKAVTPMHWASASTWLRDGGDEGLSVQPWHDFMLDAQCWWHQHLSGVLFAHVVGLHRLQPLPRSTWARRATRRPLQMQCDPTQSTLDELRSLVDCAHVRTDRMVTVMETTRVAAKLAAKRQPPGTSRLSLAREIRAILPTAAAHGRAQLLVLSGCLHLVEGGGARGRLLSPRSLAGYICETCLPLARELATRDVDGLDGSAWRQVYQVVLDRVKPSQRGKAEAFLTAFHRFMIEFGAEPLDASLSKRLELDPPAAQMIWPHELERAIEIVRATPVGDRVRDQAELGLRLASIVPIRVNELWDIRLRDLSFTDWGVILSVYPRPQDGANKSAATRRTVDIVDAALVSMLTDFVRRRLLEAGAEGDLLLGAPRAPGQRWEERATNELMNRSLRAATGDPRVSFHDLRRAAIARPIGAALAPGHVATDRSEMQAISAWVGHSRPNSTRAYTHQFEAAIAAHAALARPGSREGPSQAMLVGAGLADVSDGFEFSDASVWGDNITMVPGPVSIGIDRAAAVLEDVARGYTLDAVVLRSDTSMGTVLQLIEAAFQAIAICGRWNGARAPLPVDHCQSLAGRFRWLRAARQSRFSSVPVALQEMLSSRPASLDELLRCWNACLVGEDIGLENIAAASCLLAFIDQLRMPRDRLLVTTVQGPLTRLAVLGQRRITVRTMPPRRGRAKHRLHICSEPGATVALGTSATAMGGFHGWMIVAAAALALARAEPAQERP